MKISKINNNEKIRLLTGSQDIDAVKIATLKDNIIVLSMPFEPICDKALTAVYSSGILSYRWDNVQIKKLQGRYLLFAFSESSKEVLTQV